MNDESTVSSLNRRRFLQLLGATGASVALGACSNSGSGATSTSSGPSGSAPTGPVTIAFWNSMTEANLTTLKALVNQFHRSQSNITVSLVQQGSYTDTMTDYMAAAGSHTLPDLVQIESIDLQLMIDSKTIVPLGDFATREGLDLGSLLPSAVEYFKVGGTIWGLPFNESTPVMYYDQTAFEKAGLDPASPPTTLDEYKSACEAIVSKRVAKFGTSLKLTPSNFECWIAQAGATLVNNGNGRTARATSATFGDSSGKDLFAFYADMFSSRLAQATSGSGSGDFDNLLAIASGQAPMSIDTSAALGTVLSVLPKLSKSIRLGVGPLPAPPGPGGVPYGGAGLYIAASSSADKQQAAWEFIKFLLGAGPMATWSIGSGYIPITTASLQQATLTAAWKSVPQYKVAYDAVLNTKPSTATAGAVCGALAQIETNILNGITAVSAGKGASQSLGEVALESDSDIASYNSRV